MPYADATLKVKDFKAIESALWHLRFDDHADKAAYAEKISAALEDVRQQDHAVFEQRSDHYQAFKKLRGLESIWSIYEVEDLNAEHPYKGADTVVYKDHWGDEPTTAPVLGTTWAALYLAADMAIRASGDAHHAFIEGFKQKGNTVVLVTGS